MGLSWQVVLIPGEAPHEGMAAMEKKKYALTAAALSVAVILSCALTGTAQAQFNLLKSAKEAAKETVGSLGGSFGGSSGGAGALTEAEIGDGLIEALRVGTERAVRQVGTRDGYNLDPDIHIPLPGALTDVQMVLKTMGAAGLADDWELRLNRAAEAAAPEARELFWRAIDEMTVDDARRIYDGPDDAATRYFQDRMTPPLARRMRPVVDRSLAEVGALQSYDNMIGQYKSMPFVPDVTADLTGYVVEKAMFGLFHYVAIEEAAIRTKPAARTTDLLQKVFGPG